MVKSKGGFLKPLETPLGSPLHTHTHTHTHTHKHTHTFCGEVISVNQVHAWFKNGNIIEACVCLVSRN